MDTQSRCFPYRKSIVSKAFCETIEALGLCIDCSNNAAPIVFDAQQTERMRINLDTAATEAETQVSIFSENADGSASDSWSTIIFDELSATLQKARNIKRKGRDR